MNRNYTLIGLLSFILAFFLSLPIGGLLWLVLYNKDKFGADFLLFRVYSLQSMVMLMFVVIFAASAAYFYFKGLPTLSSIVSKLGGLASLAAKKPPASPPAQPPQNLGA